MKQRLTRTILAMLALSTIAVFADVAGNYQNRRLAIEARKARYPAGSFTGTRTFQPDYFRLALPPVTRQPNPPPGTSR